MILYGSLYFCILTVVTSNSLHITAYRDYWAHGR